MEEYKKVAEVATRMQVTERTVRRWIADGTLPAVKIGGRVRIARADVDAMARKVLAS